MERQAKILLDPLFEDIQDHNPPIRGIVTRNQAVVPKSPRNRGSSFATIVEPSNEDSIVPSNTPSWTFKQQLQCINPASSCNFCEAKHVFIACPKFKAHPQKEKVDFLIRNGYCFGCLQRGRMSKTAGDGWHVTSVKGLTQPCCI